MNDRILREWIGYNSEVLRGKGTHIDAMQFYGGALSAVKMLAEAGSNGNGIEELKMLMYDLTQECMAFSDALDMLETFRPTKVPVN